MLVVHEKSWWFVLPIHAESESLVINTPGPQMSMGNSPHYWGVSTLYIGPLINPHITTSRSGEHLPPTPNTQVF